MAGRGLSEFDNKQIERLNHTTKNKFSAQGFLNEEMTYTWADHKTRLFIGNTLDNYLRYDFSSESGVRKQVTKIGPLSMGFLFSTVPTKVWQDPYLTGTKKRHRALNVQKTLIPSFKYNRYALDGRAMKSDK